MYCGTQCRSRRGGWQHDAFLGNTDLWLTGEETRKVTAALAAVLEPYRNRSLADRPDGTRRARTMVSPLPEALKFRRTPD
jgi:hypothetical protein